MQLIKIPIFAFLALLLLGSCRNDDEKEPTVVPNLEVKTATNIHAEQSADYTTNPPSISGDFIKFNFETGSVTQSATAWDIAFRGTTILVNGGEIYGLSSEPIRNGNAAAYLANGTFNDITSVDTNLLKQDSTSGLAIPTGSGNGWYLYDSSNHVISAIAGKVFVIRTHDGKYAKMEILSYYKDMDSSDINTGQYYTFNYVYQPTESTDF